MNVNKISVPSGLMSVNYNIPVKGGGAIFREDWFSVNSLIYFICLTTIMFITFYYGNKVILNMTTNHSAFLLYTGFLVTLYIIFLGMYYLSWSLESIFVMILILSILLSLVAFLVMYFSKIICEETGKEEKKEETTLLGYVVLILLGVILYLGFSHSDSGWTVADTIKFIIMLILIRINYYIVKHNNLPIHKTLTDIVMVIVLFMKGKHLFRLMNEPSGKVKVPGIVDVTGKIIKVPKSLQSYLPQLKE